MMASKARRSGKLSLRVSQVIPALPQRVFDAWIQPELRRRWWFVDRGFRLTHCEIDARVGGRYCMKQVGGGEELGVPPGFEWIMEGRFLEVDAPRRLVFTWNVNHTPPVVDERVTVEFRAVPGGTEVTITHENIGSAAMRDATEGGWTELLEIQARVLEERPTQ
jgi:uncharacterized protein YndB with AHSA1/START domain